MAAFVLLATIGLIPAWSIILILAREFMVNGLRFIAAEKKIVISASFLGKIKTMLQMIAIIFLILSPLNTTIFLIGIIVYWIAIVATIISGIEYIYHGREFLK